MAPLLATTALPTMLSLLSSSCFPSPLWSSHVDPALPEDSLILHFPFDTSFLPSPCTPLSPSAAVVHAPLPPPAPPVSSDQPNPPPRATSRLNRGDLSHPVIHIQSPTIRTTFLRCPPSPADELGLSLAWLHFHFKPLGQRQLVIEVGVMDGRSVAGIVRCCSFTVRPPLPQNSSRTNLCKAGVAHRRCSLLISCLLGLSCCALELAWSLEGPGSPCSTVSRVACWQSYPTPRLNQIR